NNKDQRWSEEKAGEGVTAKIARAVYDHFEGGASATADQPSELKKGAEGQFVQALQRTLNARMSPSPNLSEDGDFGPATEATVKAFQVAKKLAVTGIANVETLKALGPLSFDDATQPPPEEIN